MMRCDDCQTLMLDHLYGLLDPAETAAVEKHLAGCPNCAAARTQAARTQVLFAKAAKSEFPQVRFTAPIEQPAMPRNRSDMYYGASKQRSRGSAARWLVAASVMALIPATLLPLSKLSNRYESAKGEADDSTRRLNEVRTTFELAKNDGTKESLFTAAKDKHTRVVAEWVSSEKAEQERKISVEVKRPLSAPPGAPSEFVIAVADKENTLNGSRVEARVHDQAGAVLFSQKIDPKREDAVRLPAEVWSRVKPRSELFVSVSAVSAAGARTELLEPLRLFGPVYATMLVTDKTSYRPGDRLYFRSLTLDRVSFCPPAREQRLHYALRKQDGPADPLAVLIGSTRIVKVVDGVVEVVTDRDGKPILGVGCGAFVLPADLADGEYTLTLTELSGPNGSPPAIAYPVTRTVKVRSGVPERFTKKIAFEAASFAPGAKVVARVDLKLGDKPIVGAKGLVTVASDEFDGPVVVLVNPQAKQDNGNAVSLTGITDDKGQFKITFSLPQIMSRGDVKLMVAFHHDGVEESVAERVPVAGKEIVVEFFPEGGKLIAGVPNRVYVRGTSSSGKPIDVRGTVAIAKGTEIVARVEVPNDPNEPGVNRGLGAFTFTPKAGQVYQLRLVNANPAALAPAIDLPMAEADGVVLTALDTVTKPGQPIRLRVYSVGKDRNLVVGAYTRGRLADTQKVIVKADKPKIVTLLASADTRGGVTRITFFEEPADKTADLIPVAERLVFRKPGELLNLSATAGTPGAVHAPGSAIDLSVAATDENGSPVPAILWAAVVNSAVAPGAKDRSLPTHFLLAGEVQTPDDLEYADFLLTDHPKAAETLDHVLATQGWRRFVEQKHAAPGSPAENLLKLNGQLPSPRATRGSSLFERYWPRFEESASELDAAQKERQAAEPVVRKLLNEYEESRRATAALSANVRNAADSLNAIRDRLSAAAGCVAILALMLGGLALARGQGTWGAAPYLIATIAAGGLAIYLAVDASRNPAEGIDDPAMIALPETAPSSVNGVAPKLPPVPPERVEPTPAGSAEPFQIFGFTIPNPMRAPPKGPPMVSQNAKTIHDDLIEPQPRGPMRAPVPAGVLSSLQAADKATAEKASAFADQRADGLFQKIEAALAGQKTDEAERVRTALPRTAPLVVREYAAPRPGSNDAAALDSDAVLWQPLIVLPTDGKTTLHFHLGSAPGGYQVLVAGHTTDGRIGSVRTFLPIAPQR